MYLAAGFGGGSVGDSRGKFARVEGPLKAQGNS